MSKAILVTGATGKQGGAVVDALVSSTASPASNNLVILAVTRNPSSGSAKALAAKSPNIKLIKGDLDDVPAIFRAAQEVRPDIWGVFSVQQAIGGGASPEKEEVQGKALIDESIKCGVKHFVYSSIDRNGDKSINNPTSIPHFVSKHRIEEHLLEKMKGSEMTYTILRPTAFMDNYTTEFTTKVFTAAQRVGMPGDKPLQLIAVKDIGHFGAQAFLEPEANRNRAISLAGDEVTYKQLEQVFKHSTGQALPTTYGVLGHALLWGVKEMGSMIKWFGDEGYGADIPALKKEYPDLMSMGQWLEKESPWAKH